MVAADWDDLCETMRQAAEGYAATDPTNAYLYRDEANDFCSQEPPASADELLVREALAATIRQAWRDRFRRSRGP